jgi:hypothetical protein
VICLKDCRQTEAENEKPQGTMLKGGRRLEHCQLLMKIENSKASMDIAQFSKKEPIDI